MVHATAIESAATARYVLGLVISRHIDWNEGLCSSVANTGELFWMIVANGCAKMLKDLPSFWCRQLSYGLKVSLLGKANGENSLNRANLEIMLFKDSAKRHPIFWRQIGAPNTNIDLLLSPSPTPFGKAAPFKDRPLRSIFHHVKQIYHPDNYGGKWTEEEDGQLKSLVMQYGHQWKRIGEILGRIGTACKDRWRDSVGHRDIKTQGKWTLEEEDKLINIVMDLTTSQGRSADSDVTWNVVSERMGTRTRDQCRSKWFVALFMSIWFSQSLRQTEISDGSLGRARKRSVASVPESRVSIATFASRTGEYETIIGDTCVVQAIKKINFIYDWGKFRVEGLNKLVKNDGVRPVWSPLDDLELLQRIYDRDYQHETEIQWASLVDHSGWNIWDARRLRLRFNSLKKRVPQYQMKKLEEILEQLIDECSKVRMDKTLRDERLKDDN
ncbi:hypothetical protein BC938DRAFT_474678 [Jimgerdemannia flammicorona]|uniref:Homeodomain-like protein n=1 Tax=Jimgerdemannia flammicorona TaxID=994334 RepID=A0A433Q1R2_9FUNG|nr:hypothetical protein BC938DRAFT_474678 [Jimgerdemannia flammicorona]